MFEGAKAKQANVPKTVEEEKRSKTSGERLCFDVSSIKAKSFGGSKFCLLIVDDATGFAWSYFLKKKSEVPEKVVHLIKHLKKKIGCDVKFLICDNAGENVKTVQRFSFLNPK